MLALKRPSHNWAPNCFRNSPFDADAPAAGSGARRTQAAAISDEAGSIASHAIGLSLRLGSPLDGVTALDFPLDAQIEVVVHSIGKGLAPAAETQRTE